MGIFIKRRGGIEYVYMLAGSSQYFLGRKDRPEDLNLQNFHRAARTIDRNMDRVLSKYLADLKECRRYMPEKEGQKYVLGRLKKMAAVLDHAASQAR